MMCHGVSLWHRNADSDARGSKIGERSPYGKIQHAMNGKAHYFDWAIFIAMLVITRGYIQCHPVISLYPHMENQLAPIQLPSGYLRK